MIIGIFTFFIIAYKLGGLNAARQNVLKLNPGKFKRQIDKKDMTADRKRLFWG